MRDLGHSLVDARRGEKMHRGDVERTKEEEAAVVDDNGGQNSEKGESRRFEVRGEPNAGRRPKEGVHERDEGRGVLPDDDEHEEEVWEGANRNQMRHVHQHLPRELAEIEHAKERDRQPDHAHFEHSSQGHGRLRLKTVVQIRRRQKFDFDVFNAGQHLNYMQK